MSNIRNRPEFVRHALRLALCYVVVLQAFLAAYGAALPGASAADTGFIICHNGSNDTPAVPGSRVPAGAPCVHCAMAASASGLAASPVAAVAAPLTIAHRIQPADHSAVAEPPSARAGLARAPPKFA